jgi:hypothetical protein
LQPHSGKRRLRSNRTTSLRYEGVNDESQSIRQEDLQQMQNHQAKRNRTGYL